MSELIATVHVIDADGNDQTFGPGDTVPAWAAKQITNPKAWSGKQPAPPAPSASDLATSTIASIALAAAKTKRGPGRPPKAATDRSGE